MTEADYRTNDPPQADPTEVKREELRQAGETRRARDKEREETKRLMMTSGAFMARAVVVSLVTFFVLGSGTLLLSGYMSMRVETTA